MPSPGIIVLSSYHWRPPSKGHFGSTGCQGAKQIKTETKARLAVCASKRGQHLLPRKHLGWTAARCLESGFLDPFCCERCCPGEFLGQGWKGKRCWGWSQKMVPFGTILKWRLKSKDLPKRWILGSNVLQSQGEQNRHVRLVKDDQIHSLETGRGEPSKAKVVPVFWFGYLP